MAFRLEDFGTDGVDLVVSGSVTKPNGQTQTFTALSLGEIDGDVNITEVTNRLTGGTHRSGASPAYSLEQGGSMTFDFNLVVFDDQAFSLLAGTTSGTQGGVQTDTFGAEIGYDYLQSQYFQLEVIPFASDATRKLRCYKCFVSNKPTFTMNPQGLNRATVQITAVYDSTRGANDHLGSWVKK